MTPLQRYQRVAELAELLVYKQGITHTEAMRRAEAAVPEAATHRRRSLFDFAWRLALAGAGLFLIWQLLLLLPAPTGCLSAGHIVMRACR